MDIVAVQADGNAPPRLLALGEVKWGTMLGTEHIDPLSLARELAQRQGFDTSATKLMCVGGAGFTPELRQRAQGSGGAIQLVDPARLYDGD